MDLEPGISMLVHSAGDATAAAALAFSDHGGRDLDALWEAINQHAIVSMADLAGNIIFANETFTRISGYSREELIGQNHRLLKSEVQGPEFWDAMWKTIASGYVWKGVVCNRAKDGSHYWVEAQISPFFGPNGQIEKYVSIRTDITAHKRALDQLELAMSLKAANEALRLRKLFLRATLDNLPFQFWLKDAQGRYLAANQVLADACGCASPEDLAGLTDLDLWPSEQALMYQAIDAQVMQSGQTRAREELDALAGEGRWVEVFIKPLTADNGTILGTVGYSHDISARKLAELEAQQHAEHLDAIFALSPDGFVSFDADRRVSHLSPAFTRMTSITMAQAHGLDEPAFAKLLGQNCATDCNFKGFETLRKGHSVDAVGPRHRIELALEGKRVLDVALRESDSSGVSQILYFRDVTYETEVERLKSEFLTTAAHELRTPMTTIFGYSEMLLHEQLEETTRFEVATVVHEQAQAVVAILNDMLDLVRIDQRRDRDMQWRVVAVQPLVTLLVNGFKLPPGRSAPLLALTQGHSTVWGDAAKVRQAVLNVLANAYKYSPAGGTVQLALLEAAAGTDGGPAVGVRITDSGIGMTPEQQARLFERFYRADTSGQQLGTGLGMCLVKEIMELHRGRVDVRSEPGIGTTVTLWFPRYQDQ